MLAAFAGGCAPALPEPQLSAIEPVWGWSGEDTLVVVEGAHLLPAVLLPTAPGADPRVDDRFDLTLVRAGERYPLSGEELGRYGAVQATVPEGLPVGLYDVELLAPSGQVATLERAFTVTSTRADHLALEVDARPYEVGEYAQVTVSLLDPSGALVAPGELLPVEITFSSSAGAAGVVLGDESGMEEIRPLGGEGAGFYALLGLDGEGWFQFTSTQPDNVFVQVEPLGVDSVLEGDQVFLPFTEGTPEAVRIDLPAEDYAAKAGVPFPVTFTLIDGNGVDSTSASATLYLRDLCGGSVEPYAVTLNGGQAETRVTVYRATGQLACEENQLQAYGTVSGASALFQVEPGDLDSFDLRLPDPEDLTLTAGEPGLLLLVRAVDSWGNALPGYAETLRFTDNVDGLDTDVAGRGGADCSGWIAGNQFCDMTLDRAAPSVVITAEGPEGVRGQSAAFEVFAGLPVLLAGRPSAPTVSAGDLYTLQVTARDAEDNLVSLDGLVLADFTVTDGLGADGANATSCESWAPTVMGGTLSCRSVRAGSTTLELAVPAWGLVGQATDPLTVTNGALHTLTLTVPSSVGAGDSFALLAEGADAYGNPYLVGDPTVDLRDSTGSLTPTALTLTAGAFSGRGSVSVAAPLVTITASQSGVDLGTASLEVEPAAVDHFAVQAPNSWVWVGEDVEVLLTAQDPYNNTVTSFTGSAVLSSTLGLFLSTSSGAFVDGEALVSLRWDSAGLQDRVTATGDGALSGVSRTLDALEADCTSGPSADLLLDGGDDAEACLVSGTVSVTARSAGTAGSAAVRRIHVEDGQGGQVSSTASSTTLTYTSAGRYAVTLVVADEAACGASDSGVVLVNAKSEPIGEVGVSLAHSTRTAGGAAADADTTVSVSALDCAGDYASGGTLYARTDRGDLTGLSAASDGLTLTLDSAGAGSFTWSGQSLGYDGEATVVVGVPGGAAWGEASLTVSGDNVRPQVAEVHPLGSTSAPVESLWVRFTEPLALASYDSKVTLVGPTGSVGLVTELNEDLTELTITLDEAVDTAAGVYTLTLSHDTTSALQIRDDSGNKLDGLRDGSARAWSGVFGAVVDSGLTVSACQASTTSFAPDGMDGLGEEADAVSVAGLADAVPSWWVLDVLDADGLPVRTQWVAGTTASQTLSWDGRADDGGVLPEGGYTLELAAVDSLDNRAEACAVEVQIEARYGVPE